VSQDICNNFEGEHRRTSKQNPRCHGRPSPDRGEWEVENHGIAPDIEVESDPAAVAAAYDAQLEKAVQVALEALKENPVMIPEHPPYPNYHKN
jgi:hypothetical protein